MSYIEHYRALAAAAMRNADEAMLPSVRDRYERSAEAWQVTCSPKIMPLVS